MSNAAGSWYVDPQQFLTGGKGGGKGGAGDDGDKTILTYPPRRFWMKAGQRVQGAFVDSPLDNRPIDEYAVPVGGQWKDTVHLTSTREPSCPLVQRFGRDYRHMIVYCTYIDVTGYVSKTGKEAGQFEVKLYGVKPKQYQKFMEDMQDDGPVNGWLCLLRRTSNEEARTGEIKKRERQIDPAEAFPYCNYAGKPLSEWWDEAESDPEAMKRLTQVFAVQVNADGSLVREVVPFNYDSVLAPKTAEEINEILGTAPIPPQDRDDRGGDKGKGKSKPAAAAPPANPFGTNLFPGSAPKGGKRPAKAADDDSDDVPF